MRSFFAMSWDPQKDGGAHAAKILDRIRRKGLRPAIEEDGFLLIDLSGSGARPSVIPILSTSGKAAGAVFGTLFERMAQAPVDRQLSQITAGPAGTLISGNGRDITRLFWGSYVLILRAGDRLVVITDPVSSIPCFYYLQDGVTALFSNLETCSFLEPRPLTINHDFLTALLCYDKIQTGQTGINEVRELCAGQRLQVVNGSCAVDTIWDPRRIAASPLSDNIPDLADQLRDTAVRSLHSLAGASDQIIVNVSGGLDSAIVLSCLRDAPARTRLRPLHHVLVSGDVSEAAYARELCRFLDCDLAEIRLHASDQLPDVNGHPLTARPFRDFVASSLPDLLGRDITDTADAVFTGQGGDHLFLASESPLGFADFVRLNGLAPGLWPALMGSAKLSGRSVWTVLGEAAKAQLVGHRSSMLASLESRAAFAACLGSPVPDMHELFPDHTNSPRDLPPAKADQVSILPHLIHLRDGIGRSQHLDVVHPLMSQPVMELCLRIPAYALCPGGTSRGLARMAFAGRIPESIRLRMTKGHAGMYFSGLLDAGIGRISEALLEGDLVACGLLDREKLHVFLTGGHYRTAMSGNRLLVIYAIEAWLRSWNRFLQGRSQSPD